MFDFQRFSKLCLADFHIMIFALNRDLIMIFLFQTYPTILVLISHSQDFLNGVCNNIMHFDQK